MMTGRFPMNLPVGRYKKPERGLLSNDVQWISSGSESFSVSNPFVTLLAQRSTFPVSVFTAYTSLGVFDDLKLKARSVEFLRHLRSEITPTGSCGGARRSFPAITS